ncbi:MAG: hypothetical protein IH828_06370 [Nitrospinae bacterium]|nr:hypothetical protein [Nitrospinota bacterium]
MKKFLIAVFLVVLVGVVVLVVGKDLISSPPSPGATPSPTASRAPAAPGATAIQRVATLEIVKSGNARLLEGPVAVTSLIKVINVSDYTASNLKINFQHYNGTRWDESKTVLPDPFEYFANLLGKKFRKAPTTSVIKPGATFEAILKSNPIEGKLDYLDEGGKMYFAVKIEWENPNGSNRCIMGFTETGYPYNPKIKKFRLDQARIQKLNSKYFTKPPPGMKDLPPIYPCTG